MPLVICPKCQKPIPEGEAICPRDGTHVAPDGAPTSLGDRVKFQADQDATIEGQSEPLARFQVEPGTVIGEYVAEERVGVGGMGEIWRGTQPLIGKQVAIKILRRKLAEDQEAIARFIQEARAVNDIKHRGLVDIFSFGDLPDGRPYFVMEFLEGKPLSTYMKEKGPLPYAEIVEIFCQICRALSATHEKGIIHRDLKSENIFLVMERGAPPLVKILDFGIAKLAQGEDEDSNLTKAGDIFGTPAYMSPEHCQGKVTASSDIYSLGCILFEMLCGRTPFCEPGEKVASVLVKQMSEPAPPPSQMVSGRYIPPEVDALVLKILSKDPEERPPSCDALAAAVAEVMGPLARSELAENLQDAKPIFFPDAATPGATLKWAKLSQQKASHKNPFASSPGDYYVGISPPSERFPSVNPPRGRFVFAAGTILLILGLGGGLGYYFLFAKPKASTIPPPVSVASAPLAPVKEEPPATSSTQPEPTPETIQITINSNPQRAEVLLGDASLGKTPLVTEIPYGEEEIQLTIKKNGFEPTEVKFVPNVSYRSDVILYKGKRDKPSKEKAGAEKKEPAGKNKKGKFQNVDEKDATFNPFGK